MYVDPNNTEKIYVVVRAEFTIDGKIVPKSIVWEDGSEHIVDRVLAKDRQCSLKAGGVGIRYTIAFGKSIRHIWLEESRWFVERK